MPRADYSVLRTTEELHAFAPAWSALWTEDPEATPFQSPEWLLPWWRHFGQPELRAIVISQPGALLGFLPFYIYREPQTGERKLLLLGVGTSDYLGGVFSPACTIEHIQGALESLCSLELLRSPESLQSEDGWDALYAIQLLPGAKLAQAFRGLSSSRAQGFDTESGSRMAAVRMSELPRKIRRNAMYYRNCAQRQGRLELSVANALNWQEPFDALVGLHSARWRERGEPGVFADERVPAWHRDALPGLARSGTLRLCMLRLNGAIIGVLYSLIDPPSRSRRTQYFYVTAYSPDHAELRPGTLLLALAIEQAAGEGVQIIDMLRGDEPYKRIWHLEAFATCGFALDGGVAGRRPVLAAGAAA